MHKQNKLKYEARHITARTKGKIFTVTKAETLAHQIAIEELNQRTPAGMAILRSAADGGFIIVTQHDTWVSGLQVIARWNGDKQKWIYPQPPEFTKDTSNDDNDVECDFTVKAKCGVR